MIQQAVVDVFMVLRRADGDVLFGLRSPSVFAGGMWKLPSGKAEPGEDALSAVIRETAEETGVVLDPRDVTFRGSVHNGTAAVARVGFVFEAAFGASNSPILSTGSPKSAMACDGHDWTYRRSRWNRTTLLPVR